MENVLVETYLTTERRSIWHWEARYGIDVVCKSKPFDTKDEAEKDFKTYSESCVRLVSERLQPEA
jgi:hypothetical protein